MLFMHQSLALKLGSLNNIGPGFWPTVLSAALIMFGCAMLFTCTFDQKNQPLSPVSILTILLSMVIYATIITKFGLIITGMLVVAVCMLAKYKSITVTSAASSVILLFSVIGFLRLIGIDTPLWPILQ
jgi:uncharacterized membrane protein YGL010W